METLRSQNIEVDDSNIDHSNFMHTLTPLGHKSNLSVSLNSTQDK
jgi:hypothetical protein